MIRNHGPLRAAAQATLVFSLTLRAPEVTRGLEISARVANLFDKDFSDPGSAEHLQDAIAQDGRSFRLRAVYRF